MIKLIDERGLYLYSQMYDVDGDGVNISESKEKATLAGAPRFVTIKLEPHGFYKNTGRRLDTNKRYKVIIVEAGLVEP